MSVDILTNPLDHKHSVLRVLKHVIGSANTKESVIWYVVLLVIGCHVENAVQRSLIVAISVRLSVVRIVPPHCVVLCAAAMRIREGR